MQVPRLSKITLSVCLSEAVQNPKILNTVVDELTAITGQKAVPTISKKDIANFKLRKKMPIGVRVTLRDKKMYEFLERLVRVALPRIRCRRLIPCANFSRTYRSCRIATTFHHPSCC